MYNSVSNPRDTYKDLITSTVHVQPEMGGANYTMHIHVRSIDVRLTSYVYIYGSTRVVLVHSVDRRYDVCKSPLGVLCCYWFCGLPTSQLAR